ncbi:DNA repair protein Rhp42 [Schizosaccharomyces japonicus yFS275]|uniref:DNA repair protein Rhp42 n=1 Tax=Schizosaccharomyces japonicus (strain yFS275 / FY16936) TaxID=402676 RepID=B6JXC2_SCHJY|nr:DNA repair protein Rhp42 [Schizosaccharomyces japonicus yFS275]EEB06023.1 DNA repair protein Rhp42 [Schizosaccharomyces japonicus yFS275]
MVRKSARLANKRKNQDAKRGGTKAIKTKEETPNDELVSIEENMSALDSIKSDKTPPTSPEIDELRSQNKEQNGTNGINSFASDDDDDDDDDEGDWEQVDLSSPKPGSPAPGKKKKVDDSVEIEMKPVEQSLTSAFHSSIRGKIVKIIRNSVHTMHTVCLILHGSFRNRWINNDELRSKLKDVVTEKQKDLVTQWGKSEHKHDDLVCLLNGLRAWWHRSFNIDEHGLRKLGYQKLGAEKITFESEKIENETAFREKVLAMHGSRDLSAQGFTAVCRAIGLRTRLVFSLQPLTFSTASFDNFSPSVLPPKNIEKSAVDADLQYPLFWTEVWDDDGKQWLAVDAAVLNGLYTTNMTWFEPKGSLAETKKLRIAIVIAYEPDLYAKDVTKRYADLSSAKSKRIRITAPNVLKTINPYELVLRHFQRPVPDAVDKLEQEFLASKDLPKEPKSLADFKNHPTYVLERHLKREEALRPGAKPVMKKTFGNGNKAAEVDVYLRADVLICKTPENYHKEGRVIKTGEQARKLVKARAVTLTRKREHESRVADSNEPVLQGLYSYDQTELYIPPPIQNGHIPKNGYGNMDCFVESMIPQGAVHLPYRGIARIARQLNVDFADAVTGFDFRKQRAIPVTTGIIVAEENAELVKQEWEKYEVQRVERERKKQEKLALNCWKRLAHGLLIRRRIAQEYGGD